MLLISKRVNKGTERMDSLPLSVCLLLFYMYLTRPLLPLLLTSPARSDGLLVLRSFH